MRKNKKYSFCKIVICFILIAFLSIGCNSFNNKTEINAKIIDSVCYDNLPRDSFIRKMYKGVQGDMTLQQADSIMQNR